MSKVFQIKSVSEIHRLLNVEKPKHPLISVCRHTPEMNLEVANLSICFDFYMISLKLDINGSINYGRNTYDFEEGTLLFSAPNQVFKITDKPMIDKSGWTLFIHPDLLSKSKLNIDADRFHFFSYAINEALHVSDKEKHIITGFVRNIENEIGQNLDRHSQNLIIQNLESILIYSQRFYDRQFYTRTNTNKDIISRFEEYISEYMNSEKLAERGVPSAQECGAALNLSGHYLSDLLKLETGKTVKEHIDLKLISKAKQQLLNSSISVKRLAYNLGFEYPQYFSRFFKNKTGMSPGKFRNIN